MRFAIGTQNPSKMMAVWKAVSQLFRANPATVPTYSAYKRCFPAAAAAAPVDSLMSSSAPEGQTPDHEIICVNAPSGVNAQPMSAAETIQGATNRARRTAELVPDADFAIGLEGGVEPVGDVWMEGGYIFTLRLKDGKSGLGCSARFPMSKFIIDRLKAGEELAEVMDDISGQLDVRSSLGMMGLITNGVLDRAEAYSHGVVFSFSPLVSPPVYWDEEDTAAATSASASSSSSSSAPPTLASA